MTIQTIDIAKIDASNRLRAINPNWVEAFAAEISLGATLAAIEVVDLGDGTYRLIAGGHRLAAHAALGLEAIDAVVWPAASFGSEAHIRLKEVQENILNYDLTALDRAIHLAAWKEAYEAIHTVQRRGGKRRGEPEPDQIVEFTKRFSAAAAEALGLSEATVSQAIQIARGIGLPIRERISAHWLATSQPELRQLAQNGPDLQSRILDLMLPDADRTVRAGSVAEAIALIEGTPPLAKAAAWEKLTGRFAKLKPAEQHKFFNANADAIDAWMATRRKR